MPITRLFVTGAAVLVIIAGLTPVPLAHADKVVPPSVPPVLQVPAGNIVHLVGHAQGTQDYACTAGAGGNGVGCLRRPVGTVGVHAWHEPAGSVVS